MGLQDIDEMTLEFFGWLGAILFAICGMPQAWQSWRDGHSNGLNWFFLLAWLFGELFTIAYVLPKMDMPLLFNYAINLIFLAIMIYYKLWPRDRKNNYMQLEYWKDVSPYNQ